MSEEIKEILDWLKDYNKDRPFGTSIYDRKILSNYITNLQQKVEQLENKIKYAQKIEQEYSALLTENSELENIRKEAIEYINNNNHIDGCLIKWEVADLLNILNKGSEE